MEFSCCTDFWSCNNEIGIKRSKENCTGDPVEDVEIPDRQNFINEVLLKHTAGMHRHLIEHSGDRINNRIYGAKKNSRMVAVTLQ